MSVEAIAVELANQVKQMHAQPGQAKAITQQLEKFQLTQQSLQVVAMILLQGTEPETVLHFAAQTLVLKVQSGTLQVTADLEASLFQLVAKYGALQHMAAVLRTLTVAYVDYVLMGYSTFGAGLMARVTTLPPVAILNVLAMLPDEARNQRLFVRGAIRGQLTTFLVRDHSEAALSAIDGCGTSMEALNALKAWIRALRFTEEMRRARALSEKYSCPGLKQVASLQLFRNVLAAFHSPSTPVTAAEACGSVMSEALLLTMETKVDLDFVLLLAESIASLSTALRGAFPVGTEHFIAEKSRQDWDLIMRSKLACRMLSEIASTHYFAMVVAVQENQGNGRLVSILQALMEAALYFVGVRHGEISSVALDFFFHLLTAYQGANDPVDEEDDIFADDAATTILRGARYARRYGEAAAEAVAIPILQPYFERLLPTLLLALCYPADPDSDDAFDAENFVSFRETCANVIADSCGILEPSWVISRIGETLDSCVTGQTGTVNAPWQKIEACIHILTAVAPKAQAGQDTVIPMVLNLLPRLVYPAKGTPGLLLRAAAGRIVTYTAGYLRFQLELNLRLLAFFASDLIPSLAQVHWQRESGEMDLLAFAQTACCQGIRSALHAGKQALAGLEGEKFSALFSALVNVVCDEKVGLEGRIALVQGIGPLLTELRDWNQIRFGLKQLTDRTGSIAQRLVSSFTPPANPNANGPAGIKVFFASLQAVGAIPSHGRVNHRDFEDSSSSNDSPTPAEGSPPHPVLAVLEEQWQLVEAVCGTFACSFEDVAQQACTTFVHIFSHARSYAAGSNILILVLGTAARCFLHRPTSSWMHLVKAFVTQFGELTRVHVQLVRVLCELSETFVKHATGLLTRNTGLLALTFDEAKMVAETFAVLSEVLRYVDLVSTVAKHGNWLRSVFHVAIVCLSDAEIDAQTLPAVAGLLHFSERVMTWIDPPLIMHAAEDTELVAKETALIVKGMLVEPVTVDSRLAQAASSVPPGANGQVLVVDQLITALAGIWSLKGIDYPQILPSVATSIRLGLVSSLASVVGGRLRSIADKEWSGLLPNQRLQDVFYQLEMNARNGRAFGKIVQDTAKDFAVERRKRMHS